MQLFWICDRFFFWSTVTFSLLGNSDHVVVSVDVLQNQKGIPLFIAQLMTIFLLIGNVFLITWEIFHGGDIFRLVSWSVSPAATEFCEWVQVGTDVYVPHGEYQIKPHSSTSLLWYLIEITSLVFTNIVNLLHLKLSSDKLVIIAKEFLKLSNLLMLIKQESITS